MSVLLVEDDPALIEVVGDVLDSEGFTCHIARTIDKAVDLVGVYNPPLVLLDQNLPDGSGLDNVKRIKAAALDAVAVYIFSAGQLTEERVLAAGADGFLAKPFDIDDLLDLVARYDSPPPSYTP